jgi:TRAP-type mannitol/chloroaromatic compound transport system permease small subunit
VPFLENAVAHASVLTILTISFERYFAICFPLKTLYMCNTRRSIFILAVVWLVSLGSASPFAIISFTELTKYHDSSIVTVCRSHVGNLWIQLYVNGTFVLFFALPFCLLVFVYSVIVLRISRESKQLRNNNSSCSKGASYTLKTRRRTVMMVGVITILFFVCLLPMRVFTIWVTYAPVTDVEKLGFEGWETLNMFVRVMFYLNSATNPIVYNVMSIKFRQAFLKTLGIRKTFPTGHTTLVTRFSSNASSYRRKSYRMSIV